MLRTHPNSLGPRLGGHKWLALQTLGRRFPHLDSCRRCVLSELGAALSACGRVRGALGGVHPGRGLGCFGAFRSVLLQGTEAGEVFSGTAEPRSEYQLGTHTTVLYPGVPVRYRQSQILTYWSRRVRGHLADEDSDRCRSQRDALSAPGSLIG